MTLYGQKATNGVWHSLARIDEPLGIRISVEYQSKRLSLGADISEQVCLPFLLDPAQYPLFEIPDWVSEGIIYQIFMDRFSNGDPKLNQDFSEDYYQDAVTAPAPGEYLAPNQEYYHFVDDWNDISGLQQSKYLPEGKPDWWCFYGGDIEGVRQKLDYLEELGVTIIYFNPLWEAKSVHKYDAADFRRVDPHFGSAKGLKELVKEMHSRGMRVILDVAFNHSGETFWAFRDCVEKGEQSAYWHWYDWYKWPLPKPLPPDFKPKDYYQCWWGIKDMPDLNYDHSRRHPFENYIRDIANADVNGDLVNYILDCAQWWVSYIGVDGFRLDVPDEVPWWFWELFRKKVKEIKPDAWLVGEIWNNAESWVSRKYFDSVMNYAYFNSPVLEFFIHRLISKTEFQTAILSGFGAYPPHAARAMMNLLGSHDTQRVMTLAKGNTTRVKQAVFFQMTSIGTPHIYYGDEIGMEGGRDPDNRRPFNWLWKNDPNAVEIREFYQLCIAVRKANKLLRDGDMEFLAVPEGLVVYRRYNDE
ncbi:MAG TPA: glycoside hydrolase family 13 protein, partial [Candidatus Cloacimonadota bacterium]|nr:glycoside hydrolase family 13 protein [Candidatus Cloacimonadota bacterium]